MIDKIAQRVGGVLTTSLRVGLLTGFATKKEDMDAPDRKNSRFDPNVVGSESFRKQSEPLLPVLGKLQEALVRDV